MVVTSITPYVWHDRCEQCRETTPLGPAVDSSGSLVELRAAELATNVRFGRRSDVLNEFGFGFDFDNAEAHGWYGIDMTPEQTGERAGYLARIIYEHGEDK